ncbi:hypothetical protein KAU92_02810 [Candidatus Bathyarchaeota archaeon]|nr:hypothetical protein [Candidatus Bathyarchaeota archaeon]
MVLGLRFLFRVDVIRSDKDRIFLRRIVDDGWEAALHLINTVGDSSLSSPRGELELLKKLVGVPVYGVTPCGKTIGFKGDVTWRIMDSLGLDYMEGYGVPNFKVRNFGEVEVI